MKILDGKALAEKIKLELKEEVEALKLKGNRAPHLAAILVGDDGASQTYVNHKVKMCNEVGFNSTLMQFNGEITEEFLLEKVNDLNIDEDIDGYIVQLPLPKHINSTNVTLAINPIKDVDGFHPENMGRMMLNLPGYIPATPYGIIQIIEHYNIETSGKDCVVVGRSNIVGKPMAMLMAQSKKHANCTVTICHSRTKNLEERLQNADIVIAAIGKPEMITGKMLKENAVVIDVGITRVDDASKKRGYRLAGDVDFVSAAEKCEYITPVPGGVGPMTVASLLKNTMQAYKNNNNL